MNENWQNKPMYTEKTSKVPLCPPKIQIAERYALRKFTMVRRTLFRTKNRVLLRGCALYRMKLLDKSFAAPTAINSQIKY
jgi:hypothetical protein